MTVLRVNPTEEYAAPRRGNTFADPARRGAWAYPASGQVQNWTRGMENSRGRRRGVIDEKRSSLPVFSAEGIRWDVLVIALSLVLLLFVCILAADVEAVFAGGDRIGRLSAGIESLEGSNSMLRQELSAALNHPVLRNKAADTETLNERIVVLSPAPQE